MQSLAAVTLAEGGDRKTSRLLWRALSQSADNEWLRHDAQRRLVQLVLARVRAEGEELEVAVLQGRGGAQQLGELVHELLVVAPVVPVVPVVSVPVPVIRRHRGILPHARPSFIHLSEICGTDA